MPSQAPSSIAAIVGQNIRLARTSSGLTQRQLADRVKVDPMMVSKWERGRHRPNDANLMELAAITNRDVGWFYVDRPLEDIAA